MLSQEALSPIDEISAKIQARVAKFLTLKDKLISLMRNPSVTISGEAKSLYTQQIFLEGKLSSVLQQIEIMKQGSWTFSQIAELGLFYASMEKQIRNVSELEDTGKVTDTIGTSPAAALDLIPWLIGGAVTLGFFALWKRR